MTDDFDLFITAEEAWPAFERAVLGAKSSVVAGFRIFDMSTKLRSEEGRAIGETWFDLLAHILSKGVKLSLVVSDFDPVMATELHEIACTTVRQGAALGEITDAPKDLLKVRSHLHPARAGLVPRVAFFPLVRRRQQAARREVDRVRLKRQRGGLESSGLPSIHPATHHQKVAVIDDELLYIGGLDLNERRFDTPDHDRPAEATWSDVQLLVRGPEAKAARLHLETFEAATAGRTKPPSCPGLKRTLSAPRRFQLPFLSPRTILSEIEEAHITAFSRAEHLIYIETQYVRSSVIAEALAEAGSKNPDLTSVIILPTLPDDIAFEDDIGIDARFGLSRRQNAIQILQQAFGNRLTLAVPVQPRLAARETRSTLAGSPVIHVHNKVLVQDDRYVLVGSANLNGRSMRWDTEIALELTDPKRVSRARDRLMQHWWHEPLPMEAQNPATLQGWWASNIVKNGVSLPENRSGLLVPLDVHQGETIAQPLPGITEDLV
ncbi:phosphatidylserine synthase [Aliiroseovarius sp. Z3]|uniref:phospholipase D family protein n=1 Tax=Aliiroseovarius sp. Z3 TaxID=2811402 RepID=UPI0023B29990|nr:phospholipase D-like domain-containing protein [Aliiroseovarius sp. Z3]MDE9449949.1 phosphatidylserine synthase [Aliiroseovarius sp. Z3]